eukprot:54217-Eustigmatos_ZCMA.PRE.1
MEGLVTGILCLRQLQCEDLVKRVVEFLLPSPDGTDDRIEELFQNHAAYHLCSFPCWIVREWDTDIFFRVIREEDYPTYIRLINQDRVDRLFNRLDELSEDECTELQCAVCTLECEMI